MAYRMESIVRLLALIAPTAIALAAAQDAQLPRLYTNEAAIEDATRRSTLAIDDPVAVFAFVLGALPDRVRVYPTENYYYFSFVLNGTRYLGNIRLPAAERDSGKLRFEYYQETSAGSGQGRAVHAILDSSHGVTVKAQRASFSFSKICRACDRPKARSGRMRNSSVRSSMNQACDFISSTIRD
jgi:hypothetical protein